MFCFLKAVKHFFVYSLTVVLIFVDMLPSAWVYILTNKNGFVLYVGVTTNLNSRLFEHSTGQSRKSFTFRYNVTKLVYYEGFDTVKQAIIREKYIKGKSREWKESLVNSKNPDWKDLRNEVGNLI